MTFPDLSADLQAKLPELRGRLSVAVGDIEVEDVRVSCSCDKCATEERAGVEARDLGRLDDSVRDIRGHRNLRLRLGNPLWILVDGREILDPCETAREALVLEENPRRRAVERVLT